MARLFGLIGNRAELGGRVLAHEAQALRVASRGEPLGWGVSFYQGGEVLMRRRPADDSGDVDIARLAGDVRADVVLGHVRTATVGALRTENTHPFRYRQWLFAQTGTVERFEGIRERVVAQLPEFLRVNIRGETDAEVLFYVFLSFLHDAGGLIDGAVEPAMVRDALRSSLAVMDGMSAEAGGQAGAVNLLVSDGDALVALHRGAPMAVRIFKGKDDAEAILGDEPQLRRKTPELARMHFSLIASDFDGPPPPRYRVLADRALVTLLRGDDPKIEAL